MGKQGEIVVKDGKVFRNKLELQRGRFEELLQEADFTSEIKSLANIVIGLSSGIMNENEDFCRYREAAINMLVAEKEKKIMVK